MLFLVLRLYLVTILTLIHLKRLHIRGHPKKPDKSKKPKEQTALLTTSSVGQFPQFVPAAAQFAPAAGQFVVNDPRQGFMPVHDQRQNVFACQCAPIPPSSFQPMYPYGMQSVSAPSDSSRASATVLAVGNQALPGYVDPYRAPFYAAQQPHLKCIRWLAVMHGGGGGWRLSNAWWRRWRLSRRRWRRHLSRRRRLSRCSFVLTRSCAAIFSCTTPSSFYELAWK